MMPAAKHLDPILGIDLHIIQPPPPAPPLPIPHPHVGVVMDPMDYLPLLGATVTIFGLPRAQAGTACQPIPPSHIPIGGIFVKPPGNESEVFMGSATVAIDGDAGSFIALPVLSCHDIGALSPPRPKPKKTHQFVLPTTVLLSIPLPVTIGGPPTISLMALGMRAGMALAKKGMGALSKKLKKMKKAKKAKAKNGRCADGLHPVDVVTGAQHDSFVDAVGPAGALFHFERHYTTARHLEAGPLGPGFRHSYQHRLLLFPQVWRYERPDAPPLLFTPLRAAHPQDQNGEHRLKRVDGTWFELHRGSQPVLVFSLDDDTPPDPHTGAPVATLRLIRSATAVLSLEYDRGRLTALVERNRQDDRETRYELTYGAHGQLLALRRTGAAQTELARYQYDSRGCLTTARHAAGGEHHYRYNQRSLMTEMRDPRGYQFWWRYDDQGRCIEGAGEDGLWWGKLQYNPEARETRVIERGGGEWIHRYNEDGTIVERVDPYGGIARREVNEDGEVVREVDSGGRTLTWLYDEDGVHTGRADDFGVVYPPEQVMPRLPDPHAHQVPTTALAFCYGQLLRSPQPGLGHLDEALARLPAGAREQAAACLAQAEQPELAAERETRDALGRVLERAGADGVARFHYDLAGNLVSEQDADGRVARQTVTRWNLIGERIDPLDQVTRYAYGNSEMVTRIQDAAGVSSNYSYDEKDRLTCVHRHGRLRDAYQYDAGDRLIEKRDGRGRTMMVLEYDERSLVKAIRTPAGGLRRFAYDRRGRPTEASSGEHQVLIERDLSGAITADWIDGRGITHQRTPSRVDSCWLERFVTTTLREADGSQTLVDPTGRRHRLSVHGDLVVREHGSSRLLARYHRKGRCLAQVYGRDDQPGAGWTARYAYSPAGDLLAVTDSWRGEVRYHTDAAHRLISEQRSTDTHHFAHDAAGNLVAQPGLEGVTLDGNRLVAAGGATLRYDHRDHLAERSHPHGGCTRYHYDDFDMLVRIDDGGDAPWTATYDGLARRIRAGRGRQQARFYWDGERLTARVGADGRVRLYLYPDDEARTPWLLIDYGSVDDAPEQGRVYLVLCDHLGCPVALEDSAGQIVWWARRVAPYGQLEEGQLQEGQLGDTGAQLDVRLRWPGHYHDRETGLFYNRYRYYDPQLGRYLQSDPAGQGGGINLYAYCVNPLVQVDLLGLSHDGRTSANRVCNTVAESPTPLNRLPNNHPQLKDDFLSPAQQSNFPRLRDDNFEVLQPPTSRASTTTPNCLARTAGIDNRALDIPRSFEPQVDRRKLADGSFLEDTTPGLDDFYQKGEHPNVWGGHADHRNNPYRDRVPYDPDAHTATPTGSTERVAVYTDANGEVTHVAKQRPDGTWESGSGKGWVVRHNDPEDIGGGMYGEPTHVYERGAP